MFPHVPSQHRVRHRDSPRRPAVRAFHVDAVKTMRGVLVRKVRIVHHRAPRGTRVRDYVKTFVNVEATKSQDSVPASRVCPLYDSRVDGLINLVLPR